MVRRLSLSLSLRVPHSREPNPAHDTLVPYLLREVETEQGLCMDFLGEAMARLEDDDTIMPLFTKAMVDISSKLSTLSMNDDYKPYVKVSGGPGGTFPC